MEYDNVLCVCIHELRYGILYEVSSLFSDVALVRLQPAVSLRHQRFCHTRLTIMTAGAIGVKMM